MTCPSTMSLAGTVSLSNCLCHSNGCPLFGWKGAQALSFCIIVFYHKSLTYLYWLLYHCDITNTPDQFSLEFMRKTVMFLVILSSWVCNWCISLVMLMRKSGIYIFLFPMAHPYVSAWALALVETKFPS